MYGVLKYFWRYPGTGVMSGGWTDTLAPGSCRNLGTGVTSGGWTDTLAPGSCRNLGTGGYLWLWLILVTPAPGTRALVSTPLRTLGKNAQLPHLSISDSFLDMSLISRLNIHKTFGDTLATGWRRWLVGMGELCGRVWYGMVWSGMVWYGMVIE